MKMIKRVIALVLTVVMLIQPLAFAARVTDFYDFPNDWSTEAMTAAVKNDLLRGDGDGFINPGRNLTRAELAAIMVRAFGATIMSKEQKFSDVKTSDWYYNDVYKAVQMQIMQGTGDTTFAPQASITRQEVFTVVARALCLTDGDSEVLGKYSDSNEISDWAEAPIASLIENNYINGYPDGTLNPLGKITRAELAQLLHNLFRTYISNGGYYMSVVDGSVVVRANDVHLENLTINGDLIIADGVGAGNFDLKSVTVNGRILARGGEGAVKFKDVKVTDGVIIFDPNGTVNFRNYRDEAPFKNLTELTPATFLKKPQDNGYVGGGSGGGGGSTTFETVDTAITLTAPVTGAVPQTTIDAPTYTATVQWSPTVGGTFAGDVAYTATITITPKSGYTLTGVGADSYTVNGNATTHAANAGTVSFTFPKTEPTVIDTAITLTAPVAGQRPQTSINAETYTAQVVWNPAVSGTFAHYTDYEATITITPKAGYTLDGVAANSYTVNGNATTHVANSGVVSYIFNKTAPAVVDRNITLTAPVVGETPQTTIDAPTYTATVDWSPAVAGTFDYYTDYTATISITPKTGYTLSGVTANYFTVPGALSVSNVADSGTVTATFAKTESKPIDRTLPLTIPAIGNVPMHSFSGEGYTATVVWSPADNTFGYDTDYVATITLDIDDGYRAPDEAYIVAGADSVVTNGNKTVVTAKFAKFGSTPIIGENFVIEPPVAGETPQSTLDTATYTATINWIPTVNGTFDYNTVYTAEITITPKDGYTVNGVPANSYTVNGNATTHGANANVVTYTFPRTEDAVIDTAITLTAPVAGEVPQENIDAPTYTATVVWTPTVSGTFGYYQDYTATITITPKSGYTLTGVAANSYTVNGNATTHPANSGTVVYTFPKTEPAVINTEIILAAPVAGEVPKYTIDAESYTATVVWSPTVGGTFAYYTDYAATITITPKTGYTLTGVAANSYTVNGNATTHVAGSNTVTATFPKTEPAVIDTAITLTAPVAGEVPQENIDAPTYTATVVWTPAVSGTFDYYTAYKATITITPKTGYTLTGVAANSYTVNGISINHAADAGVVEYTFPRTAPKSIDTEITITAPVVGQTPQNAIDAPTYTAVVEWTPVVSGAFGYYTQYTAKITIEPKTGYTVTGVAANSYTVNGNATTHAADSNVVEYTFDYTDKQPIGNSISFAYPTPGEKPVTSFAGEGYTANISWTGELKNEKFKYDVEYVATVTITPNTGYTYPVESEYVWSGAGSIKGISTSADKTQVTVEFYDVKSTDINGALSITVPVANKVCTQPAGTVLTGTGYSAVITGWSGGTLTDNKFGYAAEYTVTLEVTLTDGYSVPASGFSVTGATEVTHTPVDANGKTTVTVKFPATDDLVGKEINITAPVANATNISNTVTGVGFTATIVWEPAVAVGGKFAYDTAYTATITVTPDTGYTLDGVGEDYFEIDSAESVSNDANSGIVTATFAKTDKLVGDIINVIKPVAYDINPGNTVTGEGFTATIEWNPVLNAGDRFAHDTVYTATITVTPDAGYTLNGVTAGYFDVPDAVSVSNDADSGTVTAIFKKTDKLVGNIINVTKPTAGVVNTSNTVTGEGFTASIEWSPAVNVGDAFDYDTIYTAEITITPNTGYTLSGVPVDYYEIAGAKLVSNDANSGTVEATFERTAKRVGNILTITQPKAHAENYETTITGEGFTGTVSWSPNPILTQTYYDYSTEYTATVTITPAAGYTVEGIPATSNFFTVSLADPTGYVQIKSGVVPQTVITTSGGIKVAVVEIPFTETEARVGAELGEETPTPAVTEDDFKATINDEVVNGSDGTVESATTELTYNTSTVDSWKQEALANGADVSLFGLLAADNIAYGQIYYARIEVTAADGYTARGIMQNENPFTAINPDVEIVTWWVKPGSDGNVAVVIVRFPKTAESVSTVLNITSPVAAEGKQTVLTDSMLPAEQTHLDASITWYEKKVGEAYGTSAFTGANFNYNRCYKAVFTLNPLDANYTTKGLTADDFTVNGLTKYDDYTISVAPSGENEDYIVVTVEFTKATEKKPILPELGLTSPAVHAVPVESFSGEGYTATVEWAPDDATFKYDTVYVATVHLTLEEDYKVPAGDYTVAGSQNVTADADKLTVTVTYEAIETEPIHTEFAVTKPVPGGIPQTGVNCGNADGCYTADVEWFCYENGAFVPFTGTEFGYNRIYKAKITIEPIDGYSTLKIPANTYTVNGETVTHDAGADEFEFTFDITEKKKIDKTLPLTVPELDATPVEYFSGEGYTATVEWNLEAGETVFGYNKEYVATITIDLEDDYTVPTESYVVNGSKSVTADADKLVVTVTFAKLGLEPIPHRNFVIPEPVAGETPVINIACGETDNCYTATVTWYYNNNGTFVQFTGTTFDYYTEYKAEITITPSDDHTLIGVPANSYTVNGNATVHSADASVVSYIFDKTEKKKIDSDLAVTAPVIGASPVTTLTGEGYTATVEWTPDDTAFGYDKEYVATVTITLEEGYTVPDGDYTVSGAADVTANADKTVVTVTFDEIQSQTIHTEFVLTAPVAGETPETNIVCGDADGCYTANVVWYYDNNGTFEQFTGTEFGYNTVYKAEITIVPADGYSTIRVPADTYTLNGEAVTHAAGAETFEFVFEATEKKQIDKTLPLEVPQIDATPMYSFNGEGYTATVEWTPDDTTFGYDTEYVATITIVLEDGYTVPDEDYVVNGAKSVTADADKLVVEVVFNKINSTIIHTALELTAPVAGKTPVRQIVCTDASADGCFTAEVKWFDANGNELVETGTETFAHGTVYTAKITITPAEGFTTVGVPENGYTVNGEATVHPENANEVEFTFPETENEYIVRFFDGYGQYFEDATLYNADLNESEGVYTVKDGTFPHEITAYDGVDVLDTKLGFIRDYSMLLSGDAKSGVDAVDERYKNNEIHEIKNTYWYVKDGVWTEFDSTVELEPGITNVFINSQFVDLKIEVPKIADFSLDLKTNYEVDGRVADVFKDIIFAEGNEQNIIHIFSDEEITAKLLEKLVEKDIVDADGNILNQHREIYLVDVLGEARLRQMIDDVVGDAISEDGDIVGEIIERFETFDDTQKDSVVTAFHKLFESILEKELDATMKNEVRTVVYDFFDAMSLEDIKAIVNAHIAHMIESGREAEVRTLMEDMLQVYKDADYDGLKSYVTTFIKDNKSDGDISAELTKYIKSEIKAGNLNDELKGYIAGYDSYDTVVEYVAGEDLETLVDALGLKVDVDFVKSAIYSAIDMNRADFKESIRVAAGIEPEIFELLTNADIKDAVDEYIAENGISGFSGVIDDAIELVDSDATLKAEIIDDHIKTMSKATVAEKIVEMLDSDSSYFDKPVIDNVINYAVAEKLKNIDDGTISDYADTVVGTQGVDDDKFEILSGAYVNVNTSTREAITGDIIESLYAEDDFKKIIDKFIDDIFKSKKVDVEIIEYMVDHLSDASEEAKEDLEILLEDVAHDGVLLGDLAHALGIQEVEEKYEFIEQLIDELVNKKPVTVTSDRDFMFEPIIEKFNGYTYEDMESKIPEKLLQFLPREVMETLYNRFLFDEGGYVYELEKALANAKANESTVYYVTSYGAVDFNPVDDVVAPIFKFYYEKFENIDDSNRFKELYAEYFLGNPYAVAMKEYFVNADGSANIALWFDGAANDYKEEKSGYALKPFAYTNAAGAADTEVIPGRSYMDNIQALSVLSDDAMFYFYNNGYETARDEYLEKIYDKAMEYKDVFEGRNGLPTFEELTNKVGKFEDNATAKRVYEFVVRQLKSRGLDKRIISICERIPEDESKKNEAIERTELFYTAGTVADMFDYIKKAKDLIAEKTDKINKIDIVEENGRFSIMIDKGDNIISFLSDFCYDEVTADAIIEYWESEGI